MATKAMKASSLVVALALLATMLAGCNKLAAWRNAQVAESHRIAQGSKITPPTPPITVPDDVRSALPIDPSFTVLSFSQTDSSVRVTLLSAWDTQRTTEWLYAEMQRRGYENQDNPSRMLESEGLEYTCTGAKYPNVRIRVGMNTAEQATVDIAAGE